MHRRLATIAALLACLSITASAAAATYRIAVVKKAGLRVQVPAGWAPVTLTQSAVFFVRNDSERGKFRSNINVVVVPLPQKITLEQYRQALRAELKRAGFKHVTAKIRRLAAGNAVRTSYTVAAGAVTVQGAQVCFLHGLKSIVVTYTRDRAKRKVAPLFAHSIDSIRFGTVH